MKIEGTASARAAVARSVSRASAAADTGFASQIARAVQGSPPRAASAAGPLASVSSLIAIQAAEELDAAAERRRRAIRRGEKLIAGLELLHRALLEGGPSRRTLEELRGRLESRAEEVDDPALADLLREIELRVAVELAKQEARG